jgi:hypothetical protein
MLLYHSLPLYKPPHPHYVVPTRLCPPPPSDEKLKIYAIYQQAQQASTLLTMPACLPASCLPACLPACLPTCLPACLQQMEDMIS